MPKPDWSRHFAEAIPVQGRTPILTLREAAQFVLALPKAEQDAPAWQTAAEILKFVAESGGDTMLARIALLKALHHREPKAAQKPRRKKVRSYRIAK
jgi:hypothetical protein